MFGSSEAQWQAQQDRNQQLLAVTPFVGDGASSDVVDPALDLDAQGSLTPRQATLLEALSVDAARTAIKSLASLAEIGELDHLGGGLGIISPLTLTQALCDFEKVEFTLENGHCSIGYYSVLASYGYLTEERVVDCFRRSLDIAGHVSWVPGGTQLQGGRLGVMIPAAVGQALGKRALFGEDAWVICHCGDAGWISGQALNGFNVADLHGAPITFVMDRNGIQLSGSNEQIMDRDPRPIIESLGIEIIEVTSLHDWPALFDAYREARQLTREGRPCMIYPVGYETEGNEIIDLEVLGDLYGITDEVQAFAASHNVAMSTRVWIPGSLMSHRDIEPMLECVFLVNNLPGGKGHHDGSMKGRETAAVLGNPMLTLTPELQQALDLARGQDTRTVETKARPAVGSDNLVVPKGARGAVKLAGMGAKDSPRSGVSGGYELVAKHFAERMFVVSCDLNPSTKLDKAVQQLGADHAFEVSIEEQVATIVTNGLSCASIGPQFNVVSTFAAFYEGIAREGFEMWRYQRNLNGANEGLNVAFHMSHVGACTGRDHFSGWSLDWINLAIGYLPYLDRFYAPADARAAFIAVIDMAARYGGHIIGVPRDKLPILAKQDGSGPLFDPTDDFEAVTCYRCQDGARKAILALGAPAYLADEACQRLADDGTAVDAYVINGLPLTEDELGKLLGKYPEGIVTIEDGLIGTPMTGLRGFASMIASAARCPTAHIGISDPRIAPADGHFEVWEHFGITADALVEAVQSLQGRG